VGVTPERESGRRYCEPFRPTIVVMIQEDIDIWMWRTAERKSTWPVNSTIRAVLPPAARDIP
jgi:hypothetical protein